jgi:predicted phosphodiesterase
MRVCVASDLHVDVTGQAKITWPEADLLIVAGDTGNSIGAVHRCYRRIASRENYPRALVVDGNHEHYSNAPQKRTVDDTMSRLRNHMPPGFTFLPHSRHERVGDHYFLGACGWYSFDLHGEVADNEDAWPRLMNDDRWIGFSAIPQLGPRLRAVRDAARLAGTMDGIVVQDPEARFVLVTHTVPHRELLHKHPKFHVTNPFYVNCFMEAVARDHASRIDLWIYGHTHFRGERSVDGVRYLANPRGYPRENPTWEPVVVEL